MSKQITSAELAAIVSALLNYPERMGELSEASSYQSFMTDIAQVVGDHCGGDVRNPATQMDGSWLVGIHWTESVPPGGGVWRDYDPEADFEPAEEPEIED